MASSKRRPTRKSSWARRNAGPISVMSRSKDIEQILKRFREHEIVSLAAAARIDELQALCDGMETRLASCEERLTALEQEQG